MVNGAPVELIEFEAIAKGLLSSNEMHVIQRRLNNQTLAEIGLGMDLTRERIRQIESKSIRKLRSRCRSHFENYLKSIEECLDEQGGILTIKKATDTLREKRLITGSVFHDVTCALLFAQWVNVESRYTTYDDIVATEIEYGKFKKREGERHQAISQIDKVMKRTCGIISAQHPIIARIINQDALASLLNGESHDLSLFFADGSKWLTISSGRCHIATQASKVFCVCKKCDLGLLSKQLHRSLSVRLYEGRDEISPQIIADWIKTSGRFRIEGDLVSCIDEGTLSEDETIAAELLGERDSWLFIELRDRLEGALTKESLTRILHYSPIVICDKTGGRRRYSYRLLPKSTDVMIFGNEPSSTRSAIDPNHETSDETRSLNEVQFPEDAAEFPAQRVTTTTQYNRSPIVAEYILRNSRGLCECCQKRAPFLREDDEPYLEIHHVKMLSDGGSDSIANTIAVCPNCHRELHYGMNRKQLQSALYARIPRLVME
jgi:DNA-binding CsgD family transcriptional regulator